MKRRKFSAEPHVPKYRQVFENLTGDILSGKYKPGQKLPSEAALVQQFGTSRITVGRALRDLVQSGLVDRVAGSGSYVRRKNEPKGGLLFGLLIMDAANTEIFEPICHGIAASPRAAQHSLLWGSVEPEHVPADAHALRLCEQFVERDVAGVFFAPIEGSKKGRETNQKIVARLQQAKIPLILLDRCVMPYPNRCGHDLIGIDNRRAGYLATQHMIRPGIQRLSFLAYAGGAPTIEARIAGFREALLAGGGPLNQGRIHRLAAITEATIGPLMLKKNANQAFVCANDRTAGELMRTVQALGFRIPRQVRIVGIDDVEYASLLPVPLTTVHQPCREMGEAAMTAMLERIAHPKMPVRDILLECRLVVRQSCGTQPGG